MIEIKNVIKNYVGITAVDNVTLLIPQGSFVALLGPNGAGKTTLIRMLVGLAKANAGEIIIDGSMMHRGNEKIKRIIGIVPQHFNLDKELTVRENMVFCARMFKLEKKERERKVAELLELVGLSEAANQECQRLSGGMQRKLMIAKALINDPKLIILDEPTVGLDVNFRRKIWDILKTMKNTGKTILMTTHYIEEADYLCDRVALMDQGRIFYYDDPENLKRQLGKYTIEFFAENNITSYRYFKELEESQAFTASLKTEYTIRKVNLEDVFYNFTNRKVL